MVTKKESIPLTGPISATARKEILEAALKNSKAHIETTYRETGDIGFDLAVTNGLGLPEGSSVLFWADAGIGKTTLVGDVCKRLLGRAEKEGTPYRILYLATENSKELLKAMGLTEAMDSGSLIYVGEQQLTWRMVEAFYEGILQSFKGYENIKMVIIDSVNNVLSEANMQKSGADGDFGTRAKERGNFYAKYFPKCSEKGVTTMLISQARQKQDAGMYEDSKKAAVTFADRHNVEVIFKCTKKALKGTDGQVQIKTAFGDVKEQRRYVLKLDSSATDCKNRFFKGLPAEVLVVKGEGIDNSYALRKLLEFRNFLKQSAGWYTFSSAVAELLQIPEDKKLRIADVNKYIKENMGTLVQFLKDAGLYRLDADESDLSEEEDFDGEVEEEEENE